MKKKKILLVDDNRAIAFLIGTLLEKTCETLQVPNSSYAMRELFSNQSFDLVIISIDVKDSDNFRLLQHITTSSILNLIPVLVLSAVDSPALRHECEAIGSACFMTKPFGPLDFIQQTNELTLNRSPHQITSKKINLSGINS